MKEREQTCFWSCLPWEKECPKDCLLEGDGKSLDIGPKGSPLALVHLHHIQGKHQRSQGSLEPWEGDFHSMRCPANVTAEKLGGGGPSTSKQSRGQRDDRLLTHCCPWPGAAAAQAATWRHITVNSQQLFHGCPAGAGAFGHSFSNVFISGHLITGCKNKLFQNPHVPMQNMQ